MIATRMLREDHDLILSALRALDAMATARARGVDVPAAELGELLDFFRDFADAYHHANEERELFPALTEAGLPQHGGPVAVMLAEHDEGRGLLASVRALVPNADHSEAAAAELVRSARAYRGLLEQHIMKENNVLFMMAERLLGSADGRLVEAFELHARELLGAQGRARYGHLVAELLAKYPLPSAAPAGPRPCCG